MEIQIGDVESEFTVQSPTSVSATGLLSNLFFGRSCLEVEIELVCSGRRDRLECLIGDPNRERFDREIRLD